MRQAMRTTDLRALLRSRRNASTLPPEWLQDLREHLRRRFDESLAAAWKVVVLVLATALAIRHLFMPGVASKTSHLTLGLITWVSLLGLLGRTHWGQERARLLSHLLVAGAIVETCWLIWVTGGLASPAWPALMLILLGAPLLFPFRMGEAAAQAVLVGACYVLAIQGSAAAQPPATLVDRGLWLFLAALVSLASAWVTLRLIRRERFSRLALQDEQRKSEQLLLNVLPFSIAERLKAGDQEIAESFEDVSVLFADIVGFTPLAGRLSAQELVVMLDSIFSRFDALALEHDLEKIKTIGDCYMVAGGIPLPQEDHVQAVTAMGLAMLESLEAFNREHEVELAMRLGVHVGPVVAGVIGRSKFVYDLWGDTVNTASRMESHGVPGRVHMSEAFCRRLGERYRCESRGPQAIKGLGEVETFLLEGPATSP